MRIVKNGCGQSGHRTLKFNVSEEWIDKMNYDPGANTGKLKNISLIFEWVIWKMAVGIYLAHETLKSAVS